MARARLRRAEVQGVLAAIGKVPVTLTTRTRHNHRAEATEAVQIGEIGQGARKDLER